MGEAFKKLKKRHLQSAIVKSALLGVSFALICVGALLLACKLSEVSLNAGYYVLIALAAAALCGGLSFFIFKPNDKKLAVELDAQFHLNEKVQTALAFAGESGVMIEMQRADADAHLAALPKQKFSFAKIWQYVLIAVLAVALILTGILFPAKKAEGETPPPVVDPPFTLTEEYKIKLNHVIENVEKSELGDGIKTSVAEIIEQLITDLEGAEVESEMRSFVEPAVADIHLAITGATSYKQIATALSASGEKQIAQIIVDAIGIYRRFFIVEYGDVDKGRLSIGIDDATAELFTTLFAGLAEDLGNTPLTVAGALLASRVSAEDGLYVVLEGFVSGAADYDAQARLQFQYDFCDELTEQVYYLAMNKYVCNKVRSIFGLEIPPDEVFALNDSSGGSNDEDEPENSGGFGRGDVLYGSDDEVFDPDTGEYVKYGELLSKYYAIVQELLRNGELTEEQINAVRTYFDILFSGIPAEERG